MPYPPVVFFVIPLFRLKETVLHQAVMRNYLHIIVCLTEVQGYSECLNDKLKDICRTRSRGMFLQGAKHALELDAQDHKGNTPLHIAAIRGNCLMAEVLCDAGVTPDGIRNNEGVYIEGSFIMWCDVFI